MYSRIDGLQRNTLSMLLRFILSVNFTLIVILFFDGSCNTALAAATPALGPTVVTPTAIPASASTRIMVTSTIADPSVIAQSVTLQRVNSAGRVISTLGAMKDDGTSGDQVSGDKTYTLAFSLNELPGTVFLRVSAGFRNGIKRATSGVFTINVTGSTPSAPLRSSFLDDVGATVEEASDILILDGNDLISHDNGALDVLSVAALNTVDSQNFDTLGDAVPVTNQFAGMTFENTLALQSGAVGGSLNEIDFPPKSDPTVVVDNNGPITIVFTNRVLSVSGFFTHTTNLLLEAFDASNQLVGSLTDLGNNTVGNGGVPNKMLTMLVATGFKTLKITGDPLGFSFTLDNLSITYACTQDFQNINNSVNFVVTSKTTSTTAVPGGPAGTYKIDATLTNKSTLTIFPSVSAAVATLSGGNLLLSATEGTGGAGSKQAINIGNSLAPGQTASTTFLIGLQQIAPFIFTVNVQNCVEQPLVPSAR